MKGQMHRASSIPESRVAKQVADAVQAGDLPRIETLLNKLGDQADRRLLAAVAGFYMRQSHWDQATATFERISQLDTGQKLQKQLATNLATLQQIRPGVYQPIVDTAPQSHCQISHFASGQLTVTQAIADRSAVSLSRGDPPDQHAQQLLSSAADVIRSRHALLIVGVGDGYILRALSADFAQIGGDFLPTVYVIEPDPEVAVHAMMIHDYTGAFGPIRCANFRWYIGSQWEQQFRQAMLADLFLPDPSATICLSLRGQEVMARIKSILGDRQAAGAQLARRVDAHYVTLKRQSLLELLGPTPPRRPRILVVTCRFTTVLQYSASDVSAAFEQLGWHSRLMIEPSAHHRITYAGLRHAMIEFKPDVVFCIDHLRYETKDLYPENLPYICWIQDNLPNLTDRQAGGSIGIRDFVLTANRPTYCRLYGYPSRQCIDMGKLTRVPPRPTRWTSEGDDLTYVSNASHDGQEMADIMVRQTLSGPKSQQLVRICCDKILQIYHQGGCIDSDYHILQIVRSVEQDQGLLLTDKTTRHRLVARLAHPFNDALYRQQGLKWAIGVVEQLGLTLAIYGRGWEARRQFAAYSRGCVTYGPALEQLTRQTKINLRLEPYTSLSHQRMTDGLVAGGFFLHRLNHAEVELQTLANFMHEHLDPTIQNLEEATAAIAPEYRVKFATLTDRCMKLYDAEDFDPVQGVRISQAEGALALYGQPLPYLADISFDNQRQLQERVEQFIHHAALRQKISTAQRAEIESKLTYQAGMRRTINRVRELIASEPASDPVRQASG